MAIPRRARTGPAPLSFAQSRWWFLNQLEPEATALHNWARVTQWRGPLDPPILQRSLAEMVRRLFEDKMISKREPWESFVDPAFLPAK